MDHSRWVNAQIPLIGWCTHSSPAVIVWSLFTAARGLLPAQYKPPCLVEYIPNSIPLGTDIGQERSDTSTKGQSLLAHGETRWCNFWARTSLSDQIEASLNWEHILVLPFSWSTLVFFTHLFLKAISKKSHIWIFILIFSLLKFDHLYL